MTTGSAARKYDVIVIGGGHNGLTAAALLARRGRRVLVAERRDIVGGLCAAEEFHPGYYSPGVLHDTTGIRHRLIDALDLGKHGLAVESEPPSYYGCPPEGEGLLVHHDPSRTAAEISKFSERDAERYAQYRAFIARVRGFVNGVLDDPPLDLGGLGVENLWPAVKKGLGFKRLGRADMVELIRVIPMSLADWLGEWFETDLLKATLALPAIRGAFVGPRSPGSAVNLLVWECRKGAAVRGGAGALIRALEGAARTAGADIETGAEVQRINIENGRAKGVTLAGGETIESRVVAASIDPKSVFLELIPQTTVTERFAHRIRTFRAKGIAAKIDIALTEPVSLRGAGNTDIEYFRTAEDLTQIEKAFDAVKYRLCSDLPVLDVAVSRSGDGGGQALSAMVHYAPYDLDGGWNDERRDALAARVVEALSGAVPGLDDRITAVRVLTPMDIENQYSVSGGHIYHGDHMLDQFFVRPSPECARHSTPVVGLYLCGSGSYPGGGITCAPGALCARAILG